MQPGWHRPRSAVTLSAWKSISAKSRAPGRTIHTQSRQVLLLGLAFNVSPQAARRSGVSGEDVNRAKPVQRGLYPCRIRRPNITLFLQYLCGTLGGANSPLPRSTVRSHQVVPVRLICCAILAYWHSKKQNITVYKKIRSALNCYSNRS